MASPVRLHFVLLAAVLLFGSIATAAPVDPALVKVLAVDRVGQTPGLPPAADLLSATLYRDTDGAYWLRIGMLSLAADEATARALGRPEFTDGCPVTVATNDRTLAGSVLSRDGDGYTPQLTKAGVPRPERRGDGLWLPVDADLVTEGAEINVATFPGENMTFSLAGPAAYLANCALVLHGNQGLGYTDVLHGRSEDLEGSGLDEALQAHEANSVPGNFHVSGTLQTAAEWAANTGDPQDFNAWLATGVTAGWAGMLTSAYGQHMMPFVQDDMNDWSVNIETQMVNTRYGYFPTVAWVPERVWLNTTGYPSAGVNDWIGDNWQAHGVNGVILDDDPHLAGHDNHQIHTLSGTGLRLIPRDRNFTGNIIGGNGQAALDVLTGLAGTGLGEFRIVVMAEDWEAVAEMGSWAFDTPNAKETYDWFVGKCSEESAWLSTWKLADALAQPNFNGDTFTPAPGTYFEIGGAAGYGGSDNAWYTDWAGFIPYANGGDGTGGCAGTGGNCKNYGTLWNDAYGALVAAPDNNLSQAGWYVLMTNLHETAWHDGLGGAISGWQHKYSAHIKNAMVYAEAAHWANGEYAVTTAAYFDDIDNDGYDEAVLHNDRLFAVFEGDGGRCTWLFTKNGLVNDTAVGVDNAYWADTDGDFNDVNHIAAFSDVGPNYQHLGYGIEVLSAGGSTATIRLVHDEVAKEISLTTGNPWLDATYRVGPASHWIQAGFSPSLVDLVWNAQMDRVWAGDQAFMGQHNPNTGQTVAWVLGAGGAGHQKEIAATLLKGDEILGDGVFQVRLYAGATSAPVSGEVAELRACAGTLVDTEGPRAVAAQYVPGTDRLRVTFDQPADPATADPTAFGLDEDGDDAAEVTLGLTATVLETVPAATLTFQLDATDAAAVEALNPANVLLLVAAGGVDDANGVACDATTAADAVTVAFVTTAVTIDGHVEASEWTDHRLDDAGDSAWTSANEIEALHVTWDDVYLYVAIEGRVDANSWLLYLDVDPGTANGETDLTATDAWERGASFTAPGFAADFEYGCYQHQSIYDGDGLWQLLSPTTTQDRSGEMQSAYDSFHTYGDDGGSELAIPWHTLYGLGEGNVPVGAQISLVASITWDPEPDGELGGDSTPSNLAAALPVIDNVWTLTVDVNNDGLPDDLDLSATRPVAGPTRLALRRVGDGFAFELPGTGAVAAKLEIFDLRGRRVRTLVDGIVPTGAGRRVWARNDDNGRRVASGMYLVRLSAGGEFVTRKVVVIK